MSAVSIGVVILVAVLVLWLALETSQGRHKAEALEDTLDVDVFSPPRQDWLDKTDDYLRQK